MEILPYILAGSVIALGLWLNKLEKRDKECQGELEKAHRAISDLGGTVRSMQYEKEGRE